MKKQILLFFVFIFILKTAFARGYPDCNYLKENWEGYVNINSPYEDGYDVKATVTKDFSSIKFYLQINSDKYAIGDLNAQCQNGNLTLINDKVNLSGLVYKDYLYITGYMKGDLLLINLF